MKKILLVVLMAVITNALAMELEKKPIEVQVKIGDNVPITVSDAFVQESNLIRNFLEDVSPDEESVSISLLKIESTTVIPIIESLLSATIQQSIDAIIKPLPDDQLVQLLGALEYLDIPDLLRQGLSFFAGKEFSGEMFEKFMSLPEYMRQEIWQQSGVYTWYCKQFTKQNFEAPVLAWNLDEVARLFTKDSKYLILLEPDGIEIVDLISMQRNVRQISGAGELLMQLSQGEKYIFLNEDDSGEKSSSYYSYIISVASSWMLRLKNEKIESIVDDLAVLYETEPQEDLSYVYVTYIQDLTNLSEPRLRIAETTEPSHTVLSVDKKWIAVGLPDEDIIKIYKLDDLRNAIYDKVTVLQHPDIAMFRVTSDSKYLLSASDSDVRMWSASVAQPLMVINQANVDIIQAVENSHYVLTASTASGMIWIWDLDAKKIIRTYKHKGLKSIKAFSQNVLVSRGASEGEPDTKIWDVTSDFTQAVQSLEDFGEVELVSNKYLVLSDVYEEGPLGQEQEVAECLVYDLDNLESPWYELRSDESITVLNKALFIDEIAVSIDGLIVLVDGDSGVFALVAPNEERLVVQTNLQMNFAQFSPDGKLLVTYDDSKALDVIALWKIDCGIVNNVNAFTPNQLKLLIGYYRSMISDQKYTIPWELQSEFNKLPELLRNIFKQ